MTLTDKMADKETMNKTSSISFTLPISCQVCLGKVKQPVVCPNYHAFCSVCIELWLQHNQQCPACRIPITPENPCKQVLGGPNFSEESSDVTPASTPALRRTRLDLLYKDYEDEIERLNNEVETLKTQKGDLERQLSTAASSSSALAGSPSCKGMKLKGKEVKDDVDVMLVLTSKLKEATETYEKVKRDMDKMKEVNLRLRDENSSLLRETGRLKQLVVSRSPHKYERYAMSAQASKIDQCEREIKQLKRALDRSDIYVEELENKIEAYKNKYGDIEVETIQDKSAQDSSRSQSEAANLGGSTRESIIGATGGIEGACINLVTQNRRLSAGKAVRVKREVIDDDDDDDDDEDEDDENETTGGESSFQLDKPSPITPASCLRRLTLDSNTKSSSSTSSSTSTASSAGSVSSLRSCTRQLDFGSQNEASAPPPQETGGVKSEPSSILDIPNFYPNTLEDTPSNLDTTLSNLDYSITPEFEACTKLLKAAEERVHQRRQTSLEDNNSQEYLLGIEPGTSTSQASLKPVDYKSSYILADCDPSFQFNPVFVSEAPASNSSSRLALDSQSTQRPPSAPAAPTLTNPTNSAMLSSHVTVPSATLSTRPRSAPLNTAHGTSIHVAQQYPQVNLSGQNLLSTIVPVINNPLQGQATSSCLLTTQSSTSSTTSYQISGGTNYQATQPHIRNTTCASFSGIPSYSNQLESDVRSRGNTQQQKTVYVLSGSRIAPLGERRKRSSDAGRSQHLTSSPSKTQKF